MTSRIFLKNIINFTTMATNKPCGDGHRQGAVKDRTQVYNPTNNLWVKRGPDGKFMDVKTSGGKFNVSSMNYNY